MDACSLGLWPAAGRFALPGRPRGRRVSPADSRRRNVDVVVVAAARGPSPRQAGALQGGGAIYSRRALSLLGDDMTARCGSGSTRGRREIALAKGDLQRSWPRQIEPQRKRLA